MALESMAPSVAVLSARMEELERVLKTLRASAADTDKLAAELASADGIIGALKSALVAARDRETRMRALLRSASDYAVIETDFDGCITFWNSGAESLLGWTATETLGQNVEMVFTPEDRAEGAPLRERQKALENGQSDSERWHLRKDGTTFYSHERVVGPDDGDPQRFLKLLRNRTGEHATEEARYASEEQMRLIFDSATDYAIFTLDLSGIITSWNRGAERLLGYTEDEIIGQDGRMVFTPEDREVSAPETEIANALNEGRAVNERWHLRKDGSRFWGSGLVLPLKADGTSGLLKIMRDETERHRADQTKKLLIAELNHRVKNTLAVVQAIASETLKSCAAEMEIRDALDSRLAALAQSHDILARENWRNASLTEVIKRALAPFATDKTVENRIMMKGQEIRLSPTCALSLGMAFHELATNAAKYGALSVPGGTIEIQWTHEPSENGVQVRLSWHEKNGPPVSPPLRKGFGSRLIEQALPYQLNGTARLEYAPDGLWLKMSFPWTDLEDEQNDEH